MSGFREMSQSNRFRVGFNGDMESALTLFLAAVTPSWSSDDGLTLTMRIRRPLDGSVDYLLEENQHGFATIEVETLDNQGRVVHTAIYKQCKFSELSIDLDYHSATPQIFVLRVKCATSIQKHSWSPFDVG